MYLKKIPFISKLGRDNKIIFGALFLALAGILIVVISGFYGSGFMFINLLSAAALFLFIYYKDTKENIRRFIPVSAGAVSGIMGIITFLNTFYLYSYSAGTSLLVQLVVLLSTIISVIILDEGIDIYKNKSETVSAETDLATSPVPEPVTASEPDSVSSAETDSVQ